MIGVTARPLALGFAKWGFKSRVGQGEALVQHFLFTEALPEPLPPTSPHSSACPHFMMGSSIPLWALKGPNGPGRGHCTHRHPQRGLNPSPGTPRWELLGPDPGPRHPALSGTVEKPRRAGFYLEKSALRA